MATVTSKVVNSGKTTLADLLEKQGEVALGTARPRFWKVNTTGKVLDFNAGQKSGIVALTLSGMYGDKVAAGEMSDSDALDAVCTAAIPLTIHGKKPTSDEMIGYLIQQAKAYSKEGDIVTPYLFGHSVSSAGRVSKSAALASASAQNAFLAKLINKRAE